jgi:hypothetical protein
MAEITRRPTGEVLRKRFEILMQHAEGRPPREASIALEAVVVAPAAAVAPDSLLGAAVLERPLGVN